MMTANESDQQNKDYGLPEREGGSELFFCMCGFCLKRGAGERKVGGRMGVEELERSKRN